MALQRSQNSTQDQNNSSGAVGNGTETIAAEPSSNENIGSVVSPDIEAALKPTPNENIPPLAKSGTLLGFTKGTGNVRSREILKKYVVFLLMFTRVISLLKSGVWRKLTIGYLYLLFFSNSFETVTFGKPTTCYRIQA
jgi:hypothetical protein